MPPFSGSLAFGAAFVSFITPFFGSLAGGAVLVSGSRGLAGGALPVLVSRGLAVGALPVSGPLVFSAGGGVVLLVCQLRFKDLSRLHKKVEQISRWRRCNGGLFERGQQMTGTYSPS